MARDKVLIYLNGERTEISAEHAGMMLADYLRYAAGLPGTKIVCAEGDCGACTVLRLFPWPAARKNPTYLPVNACITTVAQMDGSSLITVDALADPSRAAEASPGAAFESPPHEDPALTPVQRAMVSSHGSQCGYCTPGFVMALAGLVEKRITAKDCTRPIAIQEAKNALTGNLCRCTGYQPILDAAMSIDLSRCSALRDRFYSTAQERDLRKAMRTPLRLEHGEFRCVSPASLRDAALILRKNRKARIVAGGTDVGVMHNKRRSRLKDLVSLHQIPELYGWSIRKGSRISVGARVTLTELREIAGKKIPELARFLDLFASPQIKNSATLAGNLANASPIGDTPPFLLVAGAKVLTIGPSGRRVIAIESFYKGYRSTVLKPGEAITSIEFDVPRSSESLVLYKVSQRKDLDISTVNAAFRASWKGVGGSRQFDTVRISLGGVAATPIRLLRTEAILEGRGLNDDSLARALAVAHEEFSPIGDLRGSAAFRRVAVENLIRRFFREQASGVSG